MGLETIKLPQNPIFIVGYPRSGTTLFQRLLVTQPRLYTLPETHYFNVIENVIEWRNGDHEHIPIASLPLILETLHEKMALRFKDNELDELAWRAEKKELLSKELFEYIVSRFLLSQAPDIMATGEFRWIEKTPNHAHYLERIIHYYSQVQVLHILRHPVPSILSRKLNFPFNYETSDAELAQRWNHMIEDVERFRTLFPSHILTLRYEDLLSCSEREIARIGKFIAIPFSLGVLSQLAQQSQNATEVFILPTEFWKIEDFKHDILNSNDTYRSALNIHRIETIESIVGKSMRQYGYEPFGGQ